jgi:hypothetical protein
MFRSFICAAAIVLLLAAGAEASCDGAAAGLARIPGGSIISLPAPNRWVSGSTWTFNLCTANTTVAPNSCFRPNFVNAYGCHNWKKWDQNCQLFARQLQPWAKLPSGALHAVFATLEAATQCTESGVPSTTSVTVACSQSPGKYGNSDLSTNEGPEFPTSALKTDMALLSPHVC